MNKIFELYVLLFLFCSSIGFKNNEINRKLEEVSDKLLTNSTSIVSHIVSDVSDHKNDSNDTNSISNTSDTSSKVTDSVLEETDISSTESVSQTTIQTSILSDTISKVTDSVFEETDISAIESESQTTISTNISSDLKTTDIVQNLNQTSISSNNISKVTDSTIEEIESNITDSISQSSNNTYISDIISNETDSDFEEIELNITDSISQSSNEAFISEIISNETDLKEIDFNKTDSNSQSLNETFISDFISNETDLEEIEFNKTDSINQSSNETFISDIISNETDLEEIEFNTTDSINQSSNDTFISSDNFSNVTESDLEVIDNNTDIASFGNETSIGNITESSTNTIVDNNSTETEKTDRISLPIDSNIIYENIRPKIILTGFGNYKKFLDYITFNLYFKRINYKNLAKFMTFHVYANYWRRLRFLEQKEANCTKNLEEGDDTHYFCTILDIDPNKTISSISSNNDYEFNNGTHAINNEFDLIKSSFANSTSKFIDKQITDDLSNVNSFNNATLISQNSTTFVISGVSEKPINDKVIIISIDENNDGRLTNITCDINPLEDLKYEFICKPKQIIKTNLQGSMGKTPSGQNIVINFSEDKDGKINDYINIDNPEKEDTFIINKNYRKSSSGISGGAIAGIVIACAAVLIAIVIICVACRKPSKPPIQESVMEIYIKQ